MLATMIAGLTMGEWSERDADGFRIYLPLLALIQVLALSVIERITREPLFLERPRPPVSMRGAARHPLKDMFDVLRRDRRFAAYETAFMSYGIGWMICTALLPVIATDRLRLNYSEYVHATIVVFQLTNVLMLAPMGHVADRVGPVRLAAGSFLWLSVFPIGLMFAPNALWLGALSVLYALGMVGVQLTWTLGPVALAANAAQAAQYLAIHTTLVGLRGLFAQGLGMLLYVLTGSATPPLLMAAAGFLYGAWRMWALSREPLPTVAAEQIVSALPTPAQAPPQPAATDARLD
jgi:MFS family permease